MSRTGAREGSGSRASSAARATASGSRWPAASASIAQAAASSSRASDARSRAAGIGQRPAIAIRRAMRSCGSGWVENSPRSPPPDSGFMIIICAVSGWRSAASSGMPCE